jgi:hypothetical protein
MHVLVFIIDPTGNHGAAQGILSIIDLLLYAVSTDN